MSDFKAINYICRAMCAALLLILLYLFTTVAGSGSTKAMSIHDAWRSWGICVVIAWVGFIAGCEHKGAGHD